MSVASASASASDSRTPHIQNRSLYQHIDTLRKQLDERAARAKVELGLALGAGLSLLLFNISKYFGFFGPSSPRSEITLGILVGILALVVLVYTGRSLWSSVKKAAVELELNFEALQAAGVVALIVGALYAGVVKSDGLQLALFSNLTLLVLVVLCLDRMLNDMLLKNILQHIGLRANLNAQKIRKGERFAVKRGELVPCDAVVLEGVAELEERKFATFKRVRFASAGSEIFAGSQLSAGSLSCQALSDPEDSFIGTFQAHLDRLLNRDNTQYVLDRLGRAENFILQGIVFAAACAGIYWQGRGGTFLDLCFLISSIFLCVGVLRLLRLGLFSRSLALSSLFRGGVVLRQAEVLDNLPLVSTLVLDQPEKNGDIQIEQFELIDDRYERDRVLSAAILLAAGSDHPHFTALTNTLAALCPERELYESSDFHCYDERGVLGLIQGVEFSLGTEEFLIERGIYLEVSEVLQAQAGKRVLYLAIKDQIIARVVFALKDFVRAAQGISEIESCGIRVIACSPLPYEEFKVIGLDHLRMQSKDLFADFNLTRLREKLVALRPVALLSYALAPAQIERFADVAFVPFDDLLCSYERADVTLCDEKLAGIARAFRLSKKYRSVSWQNLALAWCASMGLLLSALLGLLTPVLALVLSSAAALLAALNLLRLR